MTSYIGRIVMKMNRIQFQPGLSLNQFLDLYASQEQCASALEVSRWPEGFTCPDATAPVIVTTGAADRSKCFSVAIA